MAKTFLEALDSGEMLRSVAVCCLVSGMVDVATNAETQLLRQSIDDPSLRAIFTVAERFYRIDARKSAGIHRIEDLKGKRITTPRNTSAHYFLVKMLVTAHLSETDITIVTIDPSTEMSDALKDGRVDAVSMWEPESERAIAAVGLRLFRTADLDLFKIRQFQDARSREKDGRRSGRNGWLLNHYFGPSPEAVGRTAALSLRRS